MLFLFDYLYINICNILHILSPSTPATLHTNGFFVCKADIGIMVIRYLKIVAYTRVYQRTGLSFNAQE